MFQSKRSLFPTTTNDPGRLWQQPYSQAGGNSPSTPTSAEIDLRAELDELFFGYKSGIRHGYPCLIRHLRRDANNKPIACTCLNSLTREADPDCSYCYGEGYLFDEEWHWTYSTYGGADGGLINRNTWMPPGAVRVDFKVFYFRYDTSIFYGDKVVEVKMDEEGNILQPVVRSIIYSPQTINKLRADNSRIEFITVYCREESALRLDDVD
jgi:hypothetical protein